MNEQAKPIRPLSDAESFRERASLWWQAARPKTLTAAMAPVAVGAAVAFAEGKFRPGPVLAAGAGAFLIQIGTNLANDYFDFVKGADTEERLGPTRVTQAGLISPSDVKKGMIATFAAATGVGTYLVAQGGPPIVGLGIASIASGIAYTGGPYPLGYNGLGDVFVFGFFGVAAVAGTHYVQSREISPTALLASVPVGALSTAILVVNNLRDAPTDAKAGKRTLAVRFGERFAMAEWEALVGGAFVTTAGLAAARRSPWLLLPMLSAPMVQGLRKSVREDTGRPLNATLAGTAKLLAVHSGLLAAGFVLERLTRR